MASGGAIQMVMTTEGYLRPHVDPALDAAEHETLLGLCPGNRQTLGAGDAPRTDLMWGPYHRLLKGHAADSELRFKASSGGVISAMAQHLLDSGKVDFILHIAADPAAPLRSRVQTSRARAEILAGAAARYGPAAPLASIGALLNEGRPFAVIGKPCDIAGIRNLARTDARAQRLITYAIAFFCAGVSSLRISEAIVAKYGLALDEVKTMRYRGHGCPGPTHIESRDGRVFEQSYDETWSEELAQDIQFRCKICPDSIGEQADIVCGDAWVGADGYAHAEHDGWNAIVARSAVGDALLREMEAAGRIVSEPIATGDLDRMQPHQVERKAALLARLAALALNRQPRPRYRGFRLAANAWIGRGRFLQNLLGTRRRIGRGANRESLPL
jgi:coenzyme F420 hydrogenase subunit beta